MFNILKNGFGLIGVSLMVCQAANADSNIKVVGSGAQQSVTPMVQQQVASKPISLVGVISDLGTGASIADATVKIKVVGNPGISATINSGAFQIDNLPANTDFELIVHSTNNAFSDKTYLGKTRDANSMNEVYQDLGMLAIAAKNDQNLEASSKL
ncbi:MAG: hypothetical protein EOO52_05525 [Gammaproteobacteria bacterium]|nr:MAG: hypothetical protein EOO52_05525 [Gammaproteobacteria bacterium]